MAGLDVWTNISESIWLVTRPQPRKPHVTSWRGSSSQSWWWSRTSEDGFNFRPNLLSNLFPCWPLTLPCFIPELFYLRLMESPSSSGNKRIHYCKQKWHAVRLFWYRNSVTWSTWTTSSPGPALDTEHLPEPNRKPGKVTVLADAQVRTHRHDPVQNPRHVFVPRPLVPASTRYGNTGNDDTFFFCGFLLADGASLLDFFVFNLIMI